MPPHIPPQVVPAPAQAPWPARGVALTAMQVPGLVASAHASHCPVQATLQHTPSAQKPLTHSPAIVHDRPVFSLQAPVASQLLMPLQLPGSSALVTATQVPPPPVQAWQVEHDALPQQVPSTQAALVQSLAAVQVCPFAFLQAPVASHDCVPLQVSSFADFTAPQVPRLAVRLQARQVPVQAVLQQYPSAQAPLVHSLATRQVCPVALVGLQTPAVQ